MTNFSKLVLKMTKYEGGCVERVNHFLKVFAFAKTIAEGEDVDDATKEILEAAAITHDIGIRVCFEKYGNCNGPHQEVEGPPIALEMLPACGFIPMGRQSVSAISSATTTRTRTSTASIIRFWLKPISS